MNGAELKTIRESLGISAQWLANQSGVKLRSVQYWESGRSPVPDDVSGMVTRIDQMLDESVNRYIDHVQSMPSPPKMIALVRYRNDSDLWSFRTDMKPLPATCHGALLARLIKRLGGAKISAHVVYMDARKYREWLSNNGMDESEQSRAAWAAEKLSKSY